MLKKIFRSELPPKTNMGGGEHWCTEDETYKGIDYRSIFFLHDFLAFRKQGQK